MERSFLYLINIFDHQFQRFSQDKTSQILLGTVNP